jgi:hypothetical protein
MGVMSWFNKRASEPETKHIEFLVEPRFANVFPEPVEAKAAIPDWYKRMPRVSDGGDGPLTGTFKSCPPMLDVFTAGYIIPFPVQITVRAGQQGDASFHWRGSFAAASMHSPEQIKGAPFDHLVAHKFHNPWIVRTPPGYSSLFTAPFNHGAKPYSLFSAIVDTDVWNVPVNFPFLWTRYPFTGTLDDGEPMMQVIPFKRDTWEGVTRAMSEPEFKEFGAESERVFSKNRHYRTNRRQKKSWTLNRGNPTPKTLPNGMPDDELHRSLMIEIPE